MSDVLPFLSDWAGNRWEGRLTRGPAEQNGSQVTSSLLTQVASYLASQGGGEGLFPTPFCGVHILQSFQQWMPIRQIHRPSLCVVLRGVKEIFFGNDRLRYGAMECSVVGMETPASGGIVEASPEKPYLGITIDIDVAMLREVLEQLETPPGPPGRASQCVFLGQVDEPLAECILRLIRLSRMPKAIPILYPSIMREICYWLLNSPHGGELCQLALPDPNIARVGKSICFLRKNFAQTLRVEQMAEVAGMSASSFHLHFKMHTSVTPLQFQKQLRLLEARRLMVAETASVVQAAYQVGYESASQFSREYARMFGAAPKKDALNQQRMSCRYAGQKAQSA
jgi:AraC-like DNA-binding protein